MRRIVDAAIGETRIGWFDGERAVALQIERWSERGRRARLGDVFRARVRRVDRSLRGAFLELGLPGEQGFLPLGKTPPQEGALIAVRCVREAARGKSPVMAALAANEPPAPVANPGGADATPASAEDRALLDAAFEEALLRDVPAPGGGRLVIEPTTALVAIDVDAADRKGSKDAERFALELNQAALAEAFRQLRLRNLGGIAAIDLLSMRSKASIAAIDAAAKALARKDPWDAIAAPLSRFGVLEVSRAQRERPIADAMLNSAGGLSAETRALAALRAIESAAAGARGRVVVAHLAPDALRWLDSGAAPWRPALEARIGGRWRLAASSAPPPSGVEIELE